MKRVFMSFFNDFPEKINFTMMALSDSLFSQFEENPIISPEVHNILRNSNDKKIIEEAVKEMKEDSTNNKVKVTLSSKESIVLSVD